MKVIKMFSNQAKPDYKLPKNRSLIFFQTIKNDLIFRENGNAFYSDETLAGQISQMNLQIKF